jgi:hypothetical protein
VLLTVPYHDFQGQSRLGHLIVAEKVAADVAAAFKEIYDSNSFRIERMELIDKYGATTTNRWRPTIQARSTAAPLTPA